jgi:hypothetical protein
MCIQIEDCPYIYRVLNKDGTLVIMTKSHGQIKRSLMMDFPKTRKIDLKRFPSIPALRNVLSSAGFRDIHAHIFPRGIAKAPTQDYLERIGKKCISMLALLSGEDFRRGQKIFRRESERDGETR